MPIYEYRCAKCGADFEEIMGPNDPAPKCPECRSEKTKKMISKACLHGGRSSGCYGGGDSSAPSSGCSGCSGGSCASCH